MINKILVFIEQRSGEIKKSSLEAVSAAKSISEELGSTVEAIIIGNNIKEINTLGKYGVKNVTHIMNKDLENYSTSAYSKLLSQHAIDISADAIFISNSAMGKDLAPFVAVNLNAGISVDCTKLSASKGNIIATRPIYAGKAFIDVQLVSVKKVFTLRPNVFEIQPLSNDKTEIVIEQIDAVDLRSKVVEIVKSSEKLDVAEADIIVSGGRGLKDAENFSMIEELAEILGAATGASRAVVDAGWRPHSEQVGQTGKTVSPNLYIAVGISGAIQHLAGMSSSKYIVAINKDKDAPIFQVADYGIAGDAFEIVPTLIEELKKDNY